MYVVSNFTYHFHVVVLGHLGAHFRHALIIFLHFLSSTVAVQLHGKTETSKLWNKANIVITVGFFITDIQSCLILWSSYTVFPKRVIPCVWWQIITATNRTNVCSNPYRSQNLPNQREPPQWENHLFKYL